ncbi:MAG: hypothetical protein LBE36_04880 [Flavobacteriaceae bacterium]|jgi:hypothetical protein|nr:hypothetical protein [Flavobacteriaceae bacterium]
MKNRFLLIIFLVLVSSCASRKTIKYKDFLSLMDYVELHYKTNTIIYQNVWDDKIYISDKVYISGESNPELNDSFILEEMKKKKILSIDIIPSREILIEIDSKPFIQRGKFIVRYLSDNVDFQLQEDKAIGLKGWISLDDRTFFYRSKPITY